MPHILSLDLENWFSGKDIFRKFYVEKEEIQLESSIKPILALLKKYNTKATFFVLGETAEKSSKVVKSISSQGHEIASHGYRHVSLNKLSPHKFEEDIKKSVHIIKSITGKKPIGFRAPMFSLNNRTKWALPILEKHGFKYDSSVFPFKSKYYGIDRCPSGHYKISYDNVAMEDPNSKIVECPIKIKKYFGIPFIISGGFYFRFYPLWFIIKHLRMIQAKGQQAVIYLHPWETYKYTPKVKMSIFSRFVTYYNLKNTLKKLEKLLNIFKFCSFEKFLMSK